MNLDYSSFITRKAYGKLLLLGEYAALLGGAALGTTLTQSLTISYESGQNSGWKILGRRPYSSSLQKLLVLIINLAQKQGVLPLKPGTLLIESSIPCGVGFGSSAALCAALTKIFFPQLDLALLERLATQAESLFHGRSSGIDTTLALRQGFGVIWPEQNNTESRFSPLRPLSWGLVAGAFERHSNTRTLVTGLIEKKQPGHSQIKTLVKELGQISSQAVELLKDSSHVIYPFADLINQAQRILTRLHLNHPKQDALFHFARQKTSALAAKLSGSGGGGAYFLLYPHKEAAYQAVSRLQQQAGLCPQPPFVVEEKLDALP